MYDIIYNPTGQSSHNARICRIILPLLVQRGIPYRLHKSAYARHTTHLTAELTRDGFPRQLIIIGGDGTINEVLNGIAHPEQVTIGLIPSGSGNDFARAMGIPTDPVKALELILSGRKKAIHFGEMTWDKGLRRFMVSCGGGFDANVCRHLELSPLKKTLNRVHLGRLCYGLAAASQFILTKRTTLTVEADGQEPYTWDKTLFATVFNTAYEGGGFRFCPMADPTVEGMDYMVVTDIALYRFIPMFIKARLGRHLGSPGVFMAPFSSLSLTFSFPRTIHTDGEVVGKSLTLCVTQSRQKVQIFCP